jgi:hypothetical protein
MEIGVGTRQTWRRRQWKATAAAAAAASSVDGSLSDVGIDSYLFHLAVTNHARHECAHFGSISNSNGTKNDDELSILSKRISSNVVSHRPTNSTISSDNNIVVIVIFIIIKEMNVLQVTEVFKKKKMMHTVSTPFFLSVFVPTSLYSSIMEIIKYCFFIETGIAFKICEN